MSAGMEVRGLRELERKLNALPKTVAKKIVRKAIRSGAAIMRDKAKGNARSMVGGSMGRLIARFITVRAYKHQSKGSYSVWMGISPRGGEYFVHTTKRGRRHYIPSAIEYGHAAPGKAGGAKAVAAIPFQRDAFDTTEARANSRVVRMIWAGILREARKPI